MSALSLQAAGGSHVGRVRRINEDSYASLSTIGLFAVADGIGGKPGGEVASGMALDIVRACLEEDDPDETWPIGTLGADREEVRLIQSLRRANRDIFAEGRRNARVRGMGRRLRVCWSERPESTSRTPVTRGYIASAIDAWNSSPAITPCWRTF